MPSSIRCPRNNGLFLIGGARKKTCLTNTGDMPIETEGRRNHNTITPSTNEELLPKKSEGLVRKVQSKPLQCDTMETKLALKMEQKVMVYGVKCCC